jgi:hypothetical protein
MNRKIALGICLTFIFVLTLSAIEDGTAAPLDKKAGYALLASFRQTFREMAVTGAGGFEFVSKSFTRLSQECRQARKDGKIDALFNARFMRLLRFFWVLVVPDPGTIMAPIIDRLAADFVEGASGEQWEATNPQNKIRLAADALAQEIVSLHIYLDTWEQRAQLLKEIETDAGLKNDKKK